MRPLAMTGYGEEPAFRRSREAGFDHALVKPVHDNTLLGLLIREEPEPVSKGKGHA